MNLPGEDGAKLQRIGPAELIAKRSASRKSCR